MCQSSCGSQGSRSCLLRLLLLLLLCVTQTIVALKCRSAEGLSDVELKRVTRTCMRKIGESTWRYGYSNGNSNGNGNVNGNNNGGSYFSAASGTANDYNNNYGQQAGNGGYYNNYDDADEAGNNNNNNNNNYNYRIGNYEHTDDILRQRNRDRDRDRSQLNRTGRTTKAPTNNERTKYNRNHNNGAHNGNNNGNGNYNNGNQQNNSNASYDNACVAHCFFEELNMLNNDDYPDRHKVSYMLSKDLRDRDLRNFYMETIQECFHYLESQRRRDKCQYSRELVSCMTEYAKANCEDWQEYSVIFN